jgi:leucyl aminopeptidase
MGRQILASQREGIVRIEVRQGAIQEQKAELIVVNLFEGVTEPGGATHAVDQAVGGRIREVLSWGDFRGKLNETTLLYPAEGFPAKRLLIVGLGKQDEFDLDKVRQVSATAARKARSLGMTEYATIVHGAGAAGLDAADAAQALAEGTCLSQYRFTRHRTETAALKDEVELETVHVVVFSAELVATIEQGVRAGEAIAAAVNWVRDLVNQPANYATPSILAEEALRMAEATGLSFQALGPAEMRELGMGALLGVAQGSVQEPRLIILEHNPGRTQDAPVVLVGKGITFDSGGISLKPGENMEAMKGDMAGAAAVMGALRAIAALGIPQRVIGLMPATENLPSGSAYKPGDVLKTITGKTIEVINTDAEGRLVLADALGYAQRYKPAAAIDMATLTGACVVALGQVAAGLFSTHDELAAKIEAASQATGEKVWRMPLWPEYARQIESDVADMKNTGGRPAGAITAAMLLSKFVADMPWAHLDIAGVSGSDKDMPYQPKGATGYGVRLLVHLLRNWS